MDPQVAAMLQALQQGGQTPQMPPMGTPQVQNPMGNPQLDQAASMGNNQNSMMNALMNSPQMAGQQPQGY